MASREERIAALAQTLRDRNTREAWTQGPDEVPFDRVAGAVFDWLDATDILDDADAYRILADKVAQHAGDGWDDDAAEVSILTDFVDHLATFHPNCPGRFCSDSAAKPPATVEDAIAGVAGWAFENAYVEHAGTHPEGKPRFCCTRAGLTAAYPWLQQQGQVA